VNFGTAWLAFHVGCGEQLWGTTVPNFKRFQKDAVRMGDGGERCNIKKTAWEAAVLPMNYARECPLD
jgi:hypothetical protein